MFDLLSKLQASVEHGDKVGVPRKRHTVIQNINAQQER